MTRQHTDLLVFIRVLPCHPCSPCSIIPYSLKAFYQLLDSHKGLLTREHIL